VQGDIIYMEKILVKSSNLISVGYDAATKVMEIEFKTGSTYQYIAVPQGVYQGLMTASSKGQYLHDHILNQFEFTEI